LEQIPVPERAIGPLAGLATRLDYIGPKVADLSKKVGKLEYIISKLAFPEGVAMPGLKIEQISFAYNLAALQGVMLEETAPFAGYIKQIGLHFPDGCNALVDVRVGHNVEQFCPREGYLALNDATPTYPFNVEVSDGDSIWVEMRNGDTVNPHNITVTVILEGTA